MCGTIRSMGRVGYEQGSGWPRGPLPLVFETEDDEGGTWLSVGPICAGLIDECGPELALRLALEAIDGAADACAAHRPEAAGAGAEDPDPLWLLAAVDPSRRVH